MLADMAPTVDVVTTRRPKDVGTTQEQGAGPFLLWSRVHALQMHRTHFRYTCSKLFSGVASHQVDQVAHGVQVASGARGVEIESRYLRPMTHFVVIVS